LDDAQVKLNTPSVPIYKHHFIRDKECLYIGTEGVIKYVLDSFIQSCKKWTMENYATKATAKGLTK